MKAMKTEKFQSKTTRIENSPLKAKMIKKPPLNRLKWNSILALIRQEVLKRNLQILAQEEKAAPKTSANGNIGNIT